jgi:hypothetical protein
LGGRQGRLGTDGYHPAVIQFGHDPTDANAVDGAAKEGFEGLHDRECIL